MFFKYLFNKHKYWDNKILLMSNKFLIILLIFFKEFEFINNILKDLNIIFDNPINFKYNCYKQQIYFI